jgi:hypothetical protein
MPVGPSAVGVVAFSTIKLLGYSAAGLYLNRKEGLSTPNPFAFGAARAVLGIAVGTAYGFGLSRLDITSTEFAFYPGLIPIRLLEWLLVLWLFYRETPAYHDRKFGYAVRGIGWSYLLDVPAIIAAFIIPGGFWIC